MNTAEVLIVGAGPAGLAAAITLSSEGRSVIVLERSHRAGGQAGTSALIENYPPFSSGFSGSHFIAEVCAQARKFGVQIEYGTEARALIPGCNSYTILTNRGAYHGRAVLLAMGLSNRHLGVPGEDLPGVHHGMRMDAIQPTDLPDGLPYAGKHVVLVGGGNSVGQAALYYLDKGARVTIIARRPLKETMSHYLVSRLRSRADIQYGEVQGFWQWKTEKLAARVAGHTVNIAVWDIDCVHIFIGQQPATDWLGDQVWKDDNGYILRDETYQTSILGVFVVGDVASKSVHRVACAVGAGNEVVPAIHEYLDSPGECEVA